MDAVIGNPKTKGHILLARRAFVEKNWSKATWQQVLQKLPEDDQAILRGLVLSVGWYPFELNLRLDRAIAETLSPDDPERIFLDMGRASANTNLRGIHASFVKQGDPHFLLSMSPKVYSSYYDKGYRTYEKTGPCSAVLRTHDAENVTHEDCLTVVGWYERAIEMSGGREVRVVETQCRVQGKPFCEYRCEWTGKDPGPVH